MTVKADSFPDVLLYSGESSVRVNGGTLRTRFYKNGVKDTSISMHHQNFGLYLYRPFFNHHGQYKLRMYLEKNLPYFHIPAYPV